MAKRNRKKYRRQYYLDNKTKERQQAKEYVLTHWQQRKEYRKRRKKEHKEFINQFLTECIYCGSKEQLLFHHRVPRTKIYKVSEMWGMRNEVVLMEIRKCEIVCEKCHIKLHKKYKNCEIVSGSL